MNSPCVGGADLGISVARQEFNISKSGGAHPYIEPVDCVPLDDMMFFFAC